MDIANVLNNLGDVYKLQCKYNDAEDYYNQALHMLIQLFGEHDVRVAHTTNILELTRLLKIKNHLEVFILYQLRQLLRNVIGKLCTLLYIYLYFMLYKLLFEVF